MKTAKKVVRYSCPDCGVELVDWEKIDRYCFCGGGHWIGLKWKKDKGVKK